MRWLVAVIALSPFVGLIIARIRGRADVKTCCPADPERDRRTARMG